LGRNQEQFLVASRSQENEIGNSLAAFRAKQAHLEWDSPTVMGPAALREAASTRDAILSKCSDESNRLLVGTVHVKCHDGSNEAEIGAISTVTRRIYIALHRIVSIIIRNFSVIFKNGSTLKCLTSLYLK